MTQQPVNYYQSTPLTAISGQPRRALAIECSRRGASVAILDVDCEGGLETVSLAETSGTNENRCSAHRFGVSALKPGRASGLRSPEPAAEVMLAGIRKNRRKILVGRDAVRGDLLSRIAPLRFIDSANSASC